jgi:hypothetical protein
MQMSEEGTGLQEGRSNARKLAGSGCPVVGTVLGLGGALVGAFLGYLLFVAIAGQGFYAIVLPGALSGVGCGALSRRKSNTLGIICGVLGLIAGILAEWRFAPFIADKGLFYFLTHIHELTRFTQVLILLGAAFAFWFGRGRKGGAWVRTQETEHRSGRINE